MRTPLLAFTISTTLAACLASEADLPPAAQAEQALQAPAATASTEQSCRSLMERQRSCTTQFIPALVAARVESDNPPGAAARDREIGREALVKDALAEWETDASEAGIAAVCDKIAHSITPEKSQQLRDSVSACLVSDACDGFVSCAVPLNLIRWKS